MTSIIRPFVTTDQYELVETINAICGESRWMSTTHFEPTSAWTHALEEPACLRHLLLVVEDADSIAGWCRIFPETCRDTKSVASLGIGLLPAYRNQGIGTALVQWSLAWATGAALQQVALTTRPDNSCAIHVFIKCGFIFTGQVYNGLVEMACELPGAFQAGVIGSRRKTSGPGSYAADSQA